MSFRWITPATLGLAAAVGFVSVPGVIGVGSLDVASASGVPTPSAVATDWGWGGQRTDGAIGGWNAPGYSGGSSATTLAEPLSSAASSAVADITPSVVNIDTVLDYGDAQAAGTGIVIGSDGLVLTNHHVVEGATEITGTVVGTGTTYTAMVLGYDPDTDVAVLDLTGASGLPVATLGSSDDVRVGDLVVGVGNAGGVGGDPTSVEGQVTALGQTITATDQDGGNAETLNDLIGTNADIRAGQSGGPLVDAAGDVVGVDVAASGYTGSGTSGYAIPIDEAKAVAQRIISGQESGSVQIGATPFLGVELAADPTASTGIDPRWGFGGGYSDPLGSTYQDTTAQDSSNESGVGIAGIVSGSAAAQAGLNAGDTITALNGTSVSTSEQLSSVISASDVGARMTIDWVDTGGRPQTATVTLGAGPVG